MRCVRFCCSVNATRRDVSQQNFKLKLSLTYYPGLGSDPSHTKFTFSVGPVQGAVDPVPDLLRAFRALSR